MEIDFESTIDDVVYFNLYILTHQNPYKKNLKYSRVFLIGFSVLCGILGILFLLVFSKYSIASIIYFSLGLYLVFAYWYRFSSNNFRKRVRKAVVKQYSSIPNEEICRHNITISEEGLRDSSEFGESTQKWPAFNSVIQTDQYIYLFLRPGKGFIVPRRVFRDDTSFNLFAGKARNYKEGVVK
jgi:hypothetical protein